MPPSMIAICSGLLDGSAIVDVFLDRVIYLTRRFHSVKCDENEEPLLANSLQGLWAEVASTHDR